MISKQVKLNYRKFYCFFPQQHVNYLLELSKFKKHYLVYRIREIKTHACPLDLDSEDKLQLNFVTLRLIFKIFNFFIVSII